jgi:hypothetical protein
MGKGYSLHCQYVRGNIRSGALGSHPGIQNASFESLDASLVIEMWHKREHIPGDLTIGLAISLYAPLNDHRLWKMNLLLTAVSGLLMSWLPLLRISPSSCRCRPWEACWPSEAEWVSFNESIGGNLVNLRPVGYVCHDPTFDPVACNTLRSLELDSGWRASQPGNGVSTSH